MMSEQHYFLKYLLFKVLNSKSYKCSIEPDAQSYCGHSLSIEGLNVVYRKAKVTPRKTGQFVALWKRAANDKTEPYSVSDRFDYYIIETHDKDQIGWFVFPKSFLGENGVLSTVEDEGKRGFRIYPPWDVPSNKSARIAKEWQSHYFIR